MRSLGVVVREGAPDAEGILARLGTAAHALGLELRVEPDLLPSAPEGARPFVTDGDDRSGDDDPRHDDSGGRDGAGDPRHDDSGGRDGAGDDLPDLVVSLGGDGTLLRAGRLILGKGIPLLGINLGHLGFLTAAGADELEQALDRVMAGEYELEPRFTLCAEVHARSGATLEHFHALNDIVVHKAGQARVARLEIRVGADGAEEDVGSFSGDGVIVSTPTGSTAYNLSAGGPIVVPTMECLTVTPICPFTLAVRPLVVPSTEAVVVLALEHDPSLVLTVDGQDGRSLADGEWVRVRRGDAPLELVRFPGATFFGTLRRKLKWAARPGAEDDG